MRSVRREGQCTLSWLVRVGWWGTISNWSQRQTREAMFPALSLRFSADCWWRHMSLKCMSLQLSLVPFWCGTHTHTFLSFFLVPFFISLRSSPVQAAAAACPNGKVKRCRLRLIQFAQWMTFCFYDKNERAESGYCRASYCATLTLTAFPSPPSCVSVSDS